VGQDARWLLGIFIFALAIRVAFVSAIEPHSFNDSIFYYYSAQALAEGHGYTFPGREHVPTAYWPPGYTAVLASIFLLPGSDVMSGRLMNALVGALGCLLLYAIGKHISNRSTGIMAALFLAAFPSHIFYSTLLLTETIYATLLLCILLLFVRALTSGATGVGVPLIIGVLLGVATLVRAEGVLLPILFGLVWWASTRDFRRGLQFCALAFAGAFAMLAPWAVRNALEMHAFVPLDTGGTVVLAISHWNGAEGHGDRARSVEVLAYYGDLPYPEREVKGAQRRLHDSLAYMVTHPYHEITLVPRRLFGLYHNDHLAVDWIGDDKKAAGHTTLDRLRIWSDVYYGLVLCLAAVGAAMFWRRWREIAYLLLGLIAYFSALIGVLFFGDPRYHAALIPVFCLLAAPAAVALKERAAGAFLAGQRTAAGRG